MLGYDAAWKMAEIGSKGGLHSNVYGVGGEGAVPHGMINWNLHSDCVTSFAFFGNPSLLILFFYLIVVS